MRKYINRLQKNFSNHPLIYLIIFYFTTRLINLTLLPIFNDEAIYLHWGWIEITRRDLFYSLFDGKQPLLMWIFGYSQKIFPDPLFAGRIISVIAGLTTLLGLFEIGKKFFTRQIAIYSVLLYIIIPIFITYDRMALMESSIAASGVWLLYWYLRNKQNPRIINFIFIGFLIGIGLFIKSSAGIFVLTLILLVLSDIFQTKNYKIKLKLFTILTLSLGFSYLILRPLLIRPDFHKIIDLNNRFSYTLYELSFLPYPKWFANIFASAEIIFWHLTPTVSVLAVFGCFLLLRSKYYSRGARAIHWLVLCLVFFILSVKNPSGRYIVAYLPILTIPASLVFEKISKYKHAFIASFLIFLPTVFYIFVQIAHPRAYFQFQNYFTSYSDMGFLNSWTSGYGVIDAINYLKSVSQKQKIDVRLIGLSGNPDDAVFIYLRNNQNIKVQYAGYLCLDSHLKQRRATKPTPEPVFLVTRDNYLNKNESCLRLLKKFNKPDNKSYIGIYTYQE